MPSDKGEYQRQIANCHYFRTRSRHTDQRRRNDEITVLLEKSSTRYVSEKAAYFLISSRGPRSHDDDVRSVT